MTRLAPRPVVSTPLPDHKQLPETDGSIVQNFQEHPQSILLTDSISLVLATAYPDGQYAIGQDCGIYWRLTTPPLEGCKA
ncbi:MAG TPA: Uma2 family endonuclease, partial [Gemmataceae bacterium]|nr:Uma2 family endonuclease [Gemmataceae bacterium]